MRAGWLIYMGMVYVAFSAFGQDLRRPSLNDDLRQADGLQEKGDVSKARKIYERLLSQIDENDRTEPHAHIFNGLSNVYAAEGDYRKAADLARRAGDIYRAIDDKDGESF